MQQWWESQLETQGGAALRKIQRLRTGYDQSQVGSPAARLYHEACVAWETDPVTFTTIAEAEETQAAADALGVPVEELQAKAEAAKRKAEADAAKQQVEKLQAQGEDLRAALDAAKAKAAALETKPVLSVVK